MSLDIDNSTNTQQNPVNLEALAQSVQAGNSEALKAAMKEIAPLLNAVNLTITKTPGGVSVTATKKSVATDVPELDEPLEYARSVDLEALIAYLQIENDEEQLEVSKNRIDSLKGGLEADHISTLQSIEKSVDEAIEAEEAAKKRKGLGILCAIIAAVATVVIGILTGGAALAAVTLVVMATTAVMSATGANEAIAKAIAESLEKDGLDKSSASKAAMLILGITAAVLAVAAMVFCPSLAAKIGKAIVRGVKAIAKHGGKKAVKTETKDLAKEGAEKAAVKGTEKAAVKGAAKEERPGDKKADRELDNLDENGNKVDKGADEKPVDKSADEKSVDKQDRELDDLDENGKKIDKGAEGKALDRDLDDGPAGGTGEAAANKKKYKEHLATIGQSAVMVGTTGVNTAAAIVTATYQEQADEASAAVKEAQAYLEEFSARLEDEKDVLAMIVQKLNDDMASLADVLESQSKVDIEITQHIGG